MQTNYKVIYASAGSGKTYALVQNLLAICLKYPRQADRIKNILALTFTNKAANEMKTRIISWLKDFASPAYEHNNDLRNIQAKLKTEGIHLPLEELHERAKNMLDYVLHHYSTLNIGTIDKFNAKLVRSFSHELGLAQNFGLEINAEPFLIEAVDKMLDDIGQENTISDAFMDFVNYSLDNDERLNINQTLYNSAKEYVQDKHYFRLMDNKDFDWKVYESLKKDLRKNINQLRRESARLAEECLALVQKKNLEISDFAKGIHGIAGFFQKFLSSGAPLLYDSVETEKKREEEMRKGSSAKSKHRQDEILEVLDFLLLTRRKIIQNHIDIQKQEQILGALLPLKVNKDIQDKLAEIEQENDIVLLSKFNVMIHENLREEPTAFIYEKIGTRFSHYFFDEFQDTSTLQWQNLIPLRDHANSQENMSFTLVGDPKQSIYRFRGGDSQLMLDIINHQDQSLISAYVESLEYNYRSAGNIVDFNNELYQFLSQYTEPQHRDIFGPGSQQIAKSSRKGRVRVNFLENTGARSADFNYTAACMREDIQKCLDQGYRFSDITILCRGNFDIFSYSHELGNLKVHYNGEQVYIKTISDSGLTLNLSSTLLALTEFLRWQENPENLQFAVKMLYYLQVLGRIKMTDFTEEVLAVLAQESKSAMEQFIFETYGVQLSSENVLQLNLYHYAEHFLHEFAVEDRETDFLFNYLEMFYAYSQNAGSTLKDFLKYWDEEASRTTIKASENVDAIQIMTIHKSKGLEFPVVLLPMQNKAPRRKGTYWFDTKDEEKLASVNVKLFDDKLSAYDEHVLDFNQKNMYQEKIDDFCLQYVATTRAAEQLFLYVEKEGKNNHLDLYTFLKLRAPLDEKGELPSAFDLYDVDEQDLIKKDDAATQTYQSKAIRFGSEKTNETAVIKIATPSKSYQNRIEKVRLGIFTHELLAKIKSSEDVDFVLESYVLEGTLTLEECHELSARIHAIVEDQKYARYFRPGQTVLNEREIMLSHKGETKMYRPDRLIETPEGIIIIDFKTGEIHQKYQQQIERYRDALEKLGKKVVDTEIIYV